MTYIEQQPQYPGHDRRRLVVILSLLFALFLAALGVFTLLISQNRAPRVGLPDVLGASAKSKPTFDRMLAGLGRPLGVAVSPDGSRFYAAEGAGSYAVKVFDKKGAPLGDLTPPHTTNTTRQPMSIAVAPDGSVYAVDRRLNQVLIFNEDGTFRDTFRPAGFGEWAPLGVAVDSSGQIYVSETFNVPGQERHRVYVLRPDGTLVRWFGQKGGAASDLMFPGHLAIDGKDRIWVADIGGVKVFGADGVYLFRLGSEGDAGVALPGGLAYSAGKIFVTDVTNHRALVFDVSGDAPVFQAQFGELGFGKGQLRYPAGIAVSGSRIYIANRENGRIDTWTQ
jgi:DNA-binding beta-propeller fold protein YncE